MTVAAYDELIAPKVVDPIRRQRLLAAFVVLGLIASAVGAGVWWHQTASDRARHAYDHALPAAEAAWPAVQAKLEALAPPPGWTLDPTFTACGLNLSETVCWQATGPDGEPAVRTAVALLTAHGATVGDHLAQTFDKAVGGGRVDCQLSDAGNTGCPGFLTWDGASVVVNPFAGNATYGLPAAVAIGRGPAYPETMNSQPPHSSPAVGEDPTALAKLTGLPTGLLATGSCTTPSSSGCLLFTVPISDLGQPTTVFNSDVRDLQARGFHFVIVGPSRAATDILTAWAIRYRSAHGQSVVMVNLRVRPDASGHASGEIRISNGGLPAS